MSDFAERAFVDGADWSNVCVEVLALWASKQIAAKAGEDAEKLRRATARDAKERAAEASHEAMVAAKFNAMSKAATKIADRLTPDNAALDHVKSDALDQDDFDRLAFAWLVRQRYARSHSTARTTDALMRTKDGSYPPSPINGRMRGRPSPRWRRPRP